MTSRARLRWIPPLLALLGVVGITLARRRGPPAGATASPLPESRRVPDFSLLERSGRTVRLADLLGQVWVADFIFTRCPGPCPGLTLQMKRLADLLPEEMRFVSLSVDPAFDTPEVLTTYADSYGADAKRWLFLTGEKKAVYSLIREGFALTVAEEGEGVLHDLRFVLVDRAGRMRGWYMGNEADEIERLEEDARHLLKEPPG